MQDHIVVVALAIVPIFCLGLLCISIDSAGMSIRVAAVVTGWGLELPRQVPIAS
ncbi:hypothetical protein DFP73DRAFT_596777 [Morchella snyderi]|nr:hypothetical protein DFP73DRAFT_596777 [Morchella snyderi]